MLKHRVYLQTRTETSDSSGAGGTVTWTDSTSPVWAAIWPVKAMERVESARNAMNITHKIRIRHRAGVTPNMRIRYGTRYFEIQGIRNLEERNVELEILAEEKT